jgi:hypothetical protein
VPNELVPRNVLRNLRRRWAPSVNHTCVKDSDIALSCRASPVRLGCGRAD